MGQSNVLAGLRCIGLIATLTLLCSCQSPDETPIKPATTTVEELLLDMDIRSTEPTPEEMRKMFRSENELARRGSSAVPDLIKVIEDKSKDRLHPAAISVLLKTHDPRSAQPIEKVLKSGTQEEREAVCNALDSKPIPSLFESVLKLAENDQVQPEVAARALGMFKDRRAVPYLTTRLEKFTLDKDSPSIIATFISALANIGDPSTLPLVKRFSGSTDSFLVAAIVIAEKKMDPHFSFAEVTRKLNEMVDSSDRHARLDGAWTLTKIDAPTAGSTWIKLTHDPDEIVRAQAAEYLARGNYQGSRAAIEALRKDPSQVVQAAAEWAIGTLDKSDGGTTQPPTEDALPGTR